MRRRAFAAMLAGATMAGQGGRKLKAAFLGASHSHAFEKARLVQASPSFELSGVWEEDPKVRASFDKLGVSWLSRDAILGDKSIEVVFVESDVRRHAEMGIAALEAGKHVHIEKPPADNLADMRRIVALAKSKKLQLQTGYMWRHNPAALKTLEAARQGWLGEIYLVQARMNTLIGADRRPEWNLFAGGQMFEQGAHLIDIVVRLLGKPARITPFLRHDGAFKDSLKDNTAAVFEYPRAMAILVSSVLQHNANPHRTLEVFGTNGNAVIRPIEPPSLEMDLAQPAGPYAAGRQRPALSKYERYTGDIEALARAVRGEQALETTPDQELDIQETLLRASRM